MSRYMLMYQIPPAWAQYSIEENQEILVDIHTLLLNYREAEESHHLNDMVIPITLNGTFMEPGEIVKLNQDATIDGWEVQFTEVILSKYKTEVYILFPADNSDDALSYWKSISRDYLFGEDFERIPNPKHIKLYHNGKCVEYTEDYMAYVPVHEDGFSSFSGTGKYRCLLSLKAVNLEDVDTLDIHYDDVVVHVK